MHAIVARMRLPFFKIYLNFVHFCPNFRIFCPFPPFFWKIACMPLLSRIGPTPEQRQWVQCELWTDFTHCYGVSTVDFKPENTDWGYVFFFATDIIQHSPKLLPTAYFFWVRTSLNRYLYRNQVKFLSNPATWNVLKSLNYSRPWYKITCWHAIPRYSLTLCDIVIS